MEKSLPDSKSSELYSKKTYISFAALKYFQKLSQFKILLFYVLMKK